MLRLFRYCLILLLLLLTVSCASATPRPIYPVDNPSTPYDESYAPDEGQPKFPELGEYWVIDVDGACGFSSEALQFADQVFEQLRKEGISEVVVICQADITGDPRFWATDWGNWMRLGHEETKRGLVWLIQPDIPPERDRITVENSFALYQNTVMDYFPVLEEAANYANYNDFDGALESIARGTNEVLRSVVD
jgi:hypothetical protein